MAIGKAVANGVVENIRGVPPAMRTPAMTTSPI